MIVLKSPQIIQGNFLDAMLARISIQKFTFSVLELGPYTVVQNQLFWSCVLVNSMAKQKGPEWIKVPLNIKLF